MIYEMINLSKKVNRFFYIQYLKRKLHIKKQNFYVYSEGFFKGFPNMKIDDNFSALRGLRMEAISNQKYCDKTIILIGKNVSIGDFCHIAATNYVEIGNGVLIGSKVLITDHQHGKSGEQLNEMPAKRDLYSKGPVIIEDNVWIGDNVVVMPGVHIGKGCIIGASTVVTNDIPPYSVVAGVPAKIIKTYNVKLEVGIIKASIIGENE